MVLFPPYVLLISGPGQTVLGVLLSQHIFAFREDVYYYTGTTNYFYVHVLNCMIYSGICTYTLGCQWLLGLGGSTTLGSQIKMGPSFPDYCCGHGDEAKYADL